MIRQRPFSAERGHRDIGGGRPAIIHVKLLQQTPQPFSRFLIVGALRAVVDFSVFNVVVASTSSTQISWVLAANTLAFGTAMLASYLLNARYTFNAPWEPGSLGRYAAIAVAPSVAWNYLGYRHFAFPGRRGPQP